MNARLAPLGVLLAAIFSIAASSAGGGKPKAPTYSAKAVHGLSFHGVRLGMSFEQVCRTLTGQGYTRRPVDFPEDPPCSPRHVDSEALAEDYFGQGWQPREQLAGKPAASVKSVAVSYAWRQGRLVVKSLSIYTDEPGRMDDLERSVVSAWGHPTRLDRWAYRVLTYAPSPRQADFDNRSGFTSCSVWFGGCGQNSGAECHAMLHRYAVPYARQVIYEWGRYIRIEDGRMVLDDARRSGLLEEMLDDRKTRVCPLPRKL